ncbi:cell wall-binding repeat-containing protein [Kineococcus sp. TBRC 1896]|uniref:Cell wall-binding repeat-containing protein n=1 Tax=Kineococcus mangrovi TaxID=1660183 RepID=A0ABV4I9V1_9ACTN
MPPVVGHRSSSRRRDPGSTTPRRLGAGLAALVGLSLLATGAAQTSPVDDGGGRLGGATRYGTAALVRGGLYGSAVAADALTASPVAFRAKVPVLPVEPGTLPAPTAQVLSMVGAPSSTSWVRPARSARPSPVPASPRPPGSPRSPSARPTAAPPMPSPPGPRSSCAATAPGSPTPTSSGSRSRCPRRRRPSGQQVPWRGRLVVPSIHHCTSPGRTRPPSTAGAG